MHRFSSLSVLCSFLLGAGCSVSIVEKQPDKTLVFSEARPVASSDRIWISREIATVENGRTTARKSELYLCEKATDGKPSCQPASIPQSLAGSNFGQDVAVIQGPERVIASFSIIPRSRVDAVQGDAPPKPTRTAVEAVPPREAVADAPEAVAVVVDGKKIPLGSVGNIMKGDDDLRNCYGKPVVVHMIAGATVAGKLERRQGNSLVLQTSNGPWNGSMTDMESIVCQ